MYFPYLRGRQNELLCLRELLLSNKLSKAIIPVIEPVHFNSTFILTLKYFMEKERRIIVISNPKVGNFREEYVAALKLVQEGTDRKVPAYKEMLENYNLICSSEFIEYAYIAEGETVDSILAANADISKSAIINSTTHNVEMYEEHGRDLVAKYTFIPKELEFIEAVEGQKVLLADDFKKAKRNADYVDTPDERLNKNHITYGRQGFIGFSDYSIVGSEFEEGGFAPTAIALHIVYFGDKNELRVHHFVSTTNDSTKDPAKKFAEAMENMIKWEHYDKLPITQGLGLLILSYEKGKYPGLGVIKKYSIMHHLEMMGRFLEGK